MTCARCDHKQYAKTLDKSQSLRTDYAYLSSPPRAPSPLADPCWRHPQDNVVYNMTKFVAIQEVRTPATCRCL